MFRAGLLVSTAMTAVTLLLSGAPAPAQTNMHTASRNPNTRFVCTYGGLGVSAWAGGSDYFSAHWQHVAVPVTGRGQTVREIKVVEAQGNRTSSSAFSVGIYSNSPSGFPGNLIAGGTQKIGRMCSRVTIPITPTKLKRNTKYWIEEMNQARWGQTNELYWEVNPNTKRRAYVQFHTFHSSYSSNSSSYTSPWTKRTTGPYLTLR